MHKFVSMALVLGSLVCCLSLVACGSTPSDNRIRAEYDHMFAAMNDTGWDVDMSAASLQNRNIAYATLAKDGRWFTKGSDGKMRVEFMDGTFAMPYDTLIIDRNGRCLDTPEPCAYFTQDELRNMYQKIDSFVTALTGFVA